MTFGRRERIAAALGGAMLVGAGIGGIVVAFEHASYAARADVLVTGARGPAAVQPLLPNLRRLADSSILAGNVDTTLHLRGSPSDVQRRIQVSTPAHTQLVSFRISDPHAPRAQQIAQEAANVFVQLVGARFGSGTQRLRASVFDPAHVVSHAKPHVVREPLIGAAVGLVVAALALVLLGRRRPQAAVADRSLARRESELATRERRLEERIATVTKREVALARRAAELDLRGRSEPPPELTPPPRPPIVVPHRPAGPPEPEPEPEAEAELPPEPEPAVEAAPAPPVAEIAQAQPARIPTLDELEELVRAQAARFPESVGEWEAYLFYLRDHADVDGRLPPNFEPLVDEIFGDLIA